MSILSQYYENIVRIDMIKKLNYTNPYEIPEITKIIVNMGVKEAAQDKKQIISPLFILELITGQKSIITKAKKSVSNFKVRKGFPIGAKVTLRGDMMYDFLLRLITVALPRIRDFRGLSIQNINSTGNISFGIRDLLIFPEVECEYDKLTKVYGANITIVTTAKTRKEALILLSGFQIPFKL